MDAGSYGNPKGTLTCSVHQPLRPFNNFRSTVIISSLKTETRQLQCGNRNQTLQYEINRSAQHWSPRLLTPGVHAMMENYYVLKEESRQEELER